MYCSHSEKHIWNIRQEEIKRNNRRFKENIKTKKTSNEKRMMSRKTMVETPEI